MAPSVEEALTSLWKLTVRAQKGTQMMVLDSLYIGGIGIGYTVPQIDRQNILAFICNFLHDPTSCFQGFQN